MEKTRTQKQLEQEIERFGKLRKGIVEVADVQIKDKELFDGMFKQIRASSKLDQHLADVKAEQERIDNLEFTNLLRKYGCNNPNGCMDAIKEEIKKGLKEL